jgi:hypothetical protein
MERCAICGCRLHRDGGYAEPTAKGRSHASKHHFVAERFFGRSTNRKGSQRERMFSECPWGQEGKTEVYCYDCHEELLHNPVLLPEDVCAFAELVRREGLDEDDKPTDKAKLAGRIQLLHRVIVAGLTVEREKAR